MQVPTRLSLYRGLLAASLVAASLAAQAQTQSVTWRLVVFDPDPSRAPLAVQAVTQALEAFGRVGKNVGLLPSPLPDLPGKPAYKMFQMGPFIQRVMTCDEAYARVDNGSTAGTRLGTVSESYVGCVFPSAVGTRMVLTFERAKSGDSIGGAILNMMAKTIQGSDEERARKLSDGVLANMRKVLPELLVDTIELPGMAAERPDGAQVDSLLAAATKKPPAAVVAAPGNTLVTVVHDLDLLPRLATRVVGMAAGCVQWDLPIDAVGPSRLRDLYSDDRDAAASVEPTPTVPSVRWARA